MRYPEFTTIVRDCQIAVTNSIIACDIADLVWVVMHGGPSDEFLVESAARTGLAWRVQSRYYGSPDDAHRRSGGYVFSILLDESDVITNLVVEALPPLVTIGAQNKSMQATPNGAPDG